MKKICILFLVLNVFSIHSLWDKLMLKEPKNLKPLILTSNSFKNNGNIPDKHTCDGKDISPEISWQNVPENTKSFALIVDDPDAKKVAGKIWVHWVVYDIPANINSLSEDIKSGDFNFGQTDFDNRKQWGGPCPPSGEHKYVFTLYALDTKLNLTGDVNKERLLKAMENHVISRAQLIGLYKRKK